MKTTLLFISLVFGLGVCAQNPVPNPGFENWSNGNPNGWTTTNILTITPISQSNQAHAGTSAAKLEVVSAFGSPISPVLMCNSVTVNQNYQTFSYYYKAGLSAGDVLYTYVILTENGSGHGAGVDSITSANNSNLYVQRSFSVQYVPPVNAIADQLTITFVISGPNSGTPSIGSNVIVDDMNLFGGVPTGIQTDETPEIAEFGLPQPNPAASSCLLPFTLNGTSQVQIELYSLDGKFIKPILNETLREGKYKAECDIHGLASGVYLIKAKINSNTLTRKLLVE